MKQWFSKLASTMYARKAAQGSSLVMLTLTVFGIVSMLTMLVGVSAVQASPSYVDSNALALDIQTETPTPTETVTETETLTATSTETVTITPTSTPACGLIFFTSSAFSQTVTPTSNRPRLEIFVQNNNSQDLWLTALSLDWSAYKAMNVSQAVRRLTFGPGGFTDSTGWTASPMEWHSNIGSGHYIPAASSMLLRFEFLNVDSGWPTNIEATKFGISATFNEMCTIQLNQQPTSTPTIAPAETETPTATPTEAVTETETPIATSTEAVTATETPTATATKNTTITPTSTPACDQIFFTANLFTQTDSNTSGRPRLEIYVQNNNSQDLWLTSATFDWSAYKAINMSQSIRRFVFGPGGFTDSTGWTASPFIWNSSIGSGHYVPANSSMLLRFEFLHPDGGWPTNIQATSFGMVATFNSMCTIQIAVQPTATPTVTPTITVSATVTATGIPATTTPTVTATKTRTLTATATKTRTPTATATKTATPISASFRSLGVQDGWVLESNETSSVGGFINATSGNFALGDDAFNRQYRGILSFDTSSLPDGAVITSVVIKIKPSAAPVGTNPFTVLGNLWVDVQPGFFGTSALQLTDFHAVAFTVNGGAFGKTPVNGWYAAPLNLSARNSINKVGSTQLRLRFGLDDNNNQISDLLTFYSGNALLAADRPVLEITYRMPVPPTSTPAPTATQVCFDC